MAGSTDNLLKRMIESQREILENQHEIKRFLRFLAHRQLRQLIEEKLQKQIERRVYELTDGQRSSRDIETEIDKEVTQRTVVSWWQNWQKLGLVEPSPRYSGRMQKVISLDEIGVPLTVRKRRSR